MNTTCNHKCHKDDENEQPDKDLEAYFEYVRTMQHYQRPHSRWGLICWFGAALAVGAGAWLWQFIKHS